ncbi:heparinase II/III family protein [Actinoplanes sp. NBRC 103695]|uniref:heparinase II/III domain-containing protein n=1 Tax=Actinoplanes sp. NBRC 103695 TaxID=3032202 RepID=UPI0024A364DF|nr:heparinase II/III family protein [Actinoplanes sp. NBRC 103695]GLY95534.1 hypothetical protein Acsp02_27890 [Actinoplanes sp. NBRC 103695]
MFVAPPSPAAAADVHVIPPDPVAIDDLGALLEIYGASATKPRARVADPTATAGCGSPAVDPVLDDERIVVKIEPVHSFTVGAIPASSWRNPPSADPTWRLNYLGLMWMKSIARRAAMDGQTKALTVIVNQALKFYQQNPDPGSNKYGWDEGTALRRLETMNCLYALTNNPALRPGMWADAKVQMGTRYYGPPNYKVHNHGLMANLQLLRAGQQLNIPEWRKLAADRMASEAPKSFSGAGTSFEQSSMYQGVNATLWGTAVTKLTEAGNTTAAGKVNKVVGPARVVYQWMTQPDGNITQVGNSYEQAGQKGSLTAPRVFRDMQTGWAIGRWSWTDPNAVYYTIRTGPSKFAHGQHDRAGGVTFSAKGVRVLVGPGAFSYDTTNNYALYQMGPQSQNVALPGGKAVTNAGGTFTAWKEQAPAHAWTVSDKMFGVAHTRGVNINRDTVAMRVSDSFPSSVSVWRQYWHLDPKWTLVSGGANGVKLVFAHPSGRRLTVTTNGRVSNVVKGVTRPPAGWHFPKFGSRVQGYEVVIRSYGRASTTTFQVS